jgi:hypothetical protein
MAEKNVNSGTQKVKAELPEWQKARVEMTRDVWKHIVDPLMLFAELVRGYDHKRGADLTMEEISSVLRLLALGAYTEPKFGCGWGGSMTQVSCERQEDAARQWVVEFSDAEEDEEGSHE